MSTTTKRPLIIIIGLLIIMSLVLTACGPTQPPTIVPIGQIAVVPNDQYDSRTMEAKDAYSQYKLAGESLTDWETRKNTDGSTFTYKLIPAAQVPQGFIGIYTKRYVEGVAQYEILPPGLYRDIPMEFVDANQPAAVVPGDKMGAYCNYDEANQEFKILKPGTYAYPASMVKLFPTGVLRYRTLAKSVLVDNPNPGDKACQSFTCETSITNAILSGTGVTMTYDVDVEFEFVLTQANARSLCDYGTPEQAVQSTIATNLRNQGRAISARQTEDEILTESGRATFEVNLRDMLRTLNAGAPINVLKTPVRGITIGDEAYQKAKAEAAQQVADEQNRGKILEIQLINAAKQNEILALIAQGWARVFEIVGCKGDWQCMQVILTSPYFNPNNVVVPATPPAAVP